MSKWASEQSTLTFKSLSLSSHWYTSTILRAPIMMTDWGSQYFNYAALYLVYLVLFQHDSLWRDTGDPGNGWWVISVVWKEQTCQIKEFFLHLSSSQVFLLVFSKYLWCIPLCLSTYELVAISLSLFPISQPSPPYAVPSPLSYSRDFLGERKSSSWSFMSSIFMYLAPSVPKSSSPSENNMPNRANRPWSGWWNSTREREKNEID